MKKSTWIVIGVVIGLIAGGLLYRHFAQDVDSRGATRLMRALEENDTAKVGKLLGAIDVNVRDKSGQTALFYAARHSLEPQVIYKLLVAGADPLLTDKQGYTALMTAAKYNPSAAVVMALAKQGRRQPQEQQQNKNKALVLATKYNTADVIKTLLVAHASPAAQVPNGPTAAAYLADNEKLTEQEKTDYRQTMLLLEILDAREQFDATTRPAAKNLVEKAKEIITKKDPVKEEVPAAEEELPAAITDVPSAELPAGQEKQMADEQTKK